jgi:ankyrin repeat protein
MARKKAVAAVKGPPRLADGYGQLLFDIWRDPSALQRHLDAGHSINALDKNGHPLLFCACGLDVTDLSKGSDTLVKQLLLAGAHVDSTSFGGFTPLMFTSSPDVVNCLLDNGADIKIEADDSSTALDEACGAGKLTVVKVLLKRGAHGHMLRKSRLHTPLAAAVNNHHEEVAILLLQELVQQSGFNINHSRLAGKATTMLYSSGWAVQSS